MSDLGDLESRILDFENAWRAAAEPNITDFLPDDGDSAERLRVLIELICVDLEFRWRSAASNYRSKKRELIDYVRSFKELGSLEEIPLTLIVEEYRARSQWGDKPGHNDFVCRFESRRSQILKRLKQVDCELQNESDSRPWLLGRSTIRDQDSHPTTTGLDALAPMSYSDFLLQEMLGAGRMGKVYRAVQRSRGQTVAIKYLRKSFQRNPSAVERFVSEARTVSQFQHAGIVPIHGLGRTPGGGYFIAMEFIDGPDLSTRLAQGPVSLMDAVDWTMQVCEAIGHAHDCGVIHCDLKPGNLLLDKAGKVRVTDFGLARSISNEPRPVDRIEGTAAFMAPEQVSAWWGPMGRHTDVYGIGAVLYALLTGEAPYRGSTLADVLAQVVSSVPITPPMELRPNVPTAVNGLCLRCLSKSPSERFESVMALSDELINCR